MASVHYSSDADADVSIGLPEPCAPCKVKERGSSIPACWYCIECAEFLCDECKVSHEAFKISARHQIISRVIAEERKNLFKTLSDLEICRVHEDKKLEFFCPNHNIFCCSVCLVETHTKCKAGLHVENKHRSKIVNANLDMKKHLNDLQETIGNVQKTLEADYNDLDAIISAIPGKFKRMRDDILHLLDKAEAKAKEIVMKITNEEKEKLCGQRIILDKLQSNVQSQLSLLEGAVSHGSTLQKILTEYEVQRSSSTYRNQVSSLIESIEKLSLDIRLKPSILESLRDSLKVYEVTFTRARQRLQTIQSKNQRQPKSAWPPLPFSGQSARNKEATFDGTIDITRPGDKLSSRITGCTFLSDSSLLLADWNFTLNLYGPDFKFICSRDERAGPGDVAAFDSSEFAVTLPSANKIQRHSLSKGKDQIQDKGLISVAYECRGISYMSRDRLVTTGLPDIMSVLQTDGTELKRINTVGLQNPYYVHFRTPNSIAYVSDVLNNRLCAVDLTNNRVVFTYSRDDFKHPCGVTNDKDGNACVCCKYTNNIHLISPSGQHVKVLLSQKQGITQPYCICFSPKGDHLVVTENNDIGQKGCVKVFSIKHK